MRILVMGAVAVVSGGLLLQSSVSGSHPGEQESLVTAAAPFDPSEDRTAPDSTPELNLAGKAHVILPHLANDRAKKHRGQAGKPESAAGLPDEVPGTMDSGLWILDDFGITGAVAYHDVQTDVVLTESTDQTLYAPTMSVPTSNGRIGCLETVTVHYRYPSQGMTQTAHAQGFWDHCVFGGWVSFKSTTDSNFRLKYVRAIGDYVVRTRVERDSGGTWRGYLFNFQTGVYEEQAAVSSTNYPCCWPGGWTMFETFGWAESGNCQSLPIIRAHSIQVQVSPGNWPLLSPTYSSRFEFGTPCFSSGQYWFHINQPNHDWQVCNVFNPC